METLSIRVKYRPLRIGWCLKKDDKATLRKALKLSHALWGGRFNPIIPIDDFDYASQLVRTFRVDLLLSVLDDDSINGFISKFPHIPNPFFHSELFVKDSHQKAHAQVLDLFHPIMRIYKNNLKSNPKSQIHAILYDWDENDPLADVLLALFGDFPPEIETGTDFRKLIEKYLSAKTIFIPNNDKIPNDSFMNPTPNWICSFGLNRHYSIDNSWNWPGFYVGSGNNFDDLVNFWNLRATGVELLFYDPDHNGRFEKLRDEYLSALHNRPKNNRAWEESVAIWCQMPEGKVDLSSFGKEIVRCVPGTATWNGLNVKAPIMHFEEKSTLAAVSERDGRISISFSLPEKPTEKQVSSFQQHLIASVSFGIGLFGNEQYTLKTPYLPGLNEYYGKSLYFERKSVRVEPDSVGIVINTRRDDLHLYALEASELVSKIFAIAGMNAHISKPGLIAARLIQQLGGIQGCRVFKVAGVRELVEKYKPEQSFTKSAAIQVIGQNDSQTGKPQFTPYERLFLEPRPWAVKLTPQAAFTYLLKHRVFRVGLDLECPNCLLDFWLSLDDVKTQSMCEFCGNHFDVTEQLKDRDWRYRRSGLFGKNNNQEGSIPVVLLLQQFDTILHSSDIVYTTALEITSDGAPIKKCETDFVILTQENVNREVQIVIGECKNRVEITKDDVDKLTRVAEAFESIGIRVFIVFAKLTDFSHEELESFKNVNTKFRGRLILLTARELEPYFVYEKTAQEYEIHEHAVSLDDMMTTTYSIFYDKKRRKKSQQNND